MWDMKPNAPVEIRGEFRPIATSVPGIQLSDQLPRLAGKCIIVRWFVQFTTASTMHTPPQFYTGLTGHDRGEIGGGARPTDHPAIGSVLGMIRPPGTTVVPYVSMPFITQEGRGGPPQPGSSAAGWVGPMTHFSCSATQMHLVLVCRNFPCQVTEHRSHGRAATIAQSTPAAGAAWSVSVLCARE